MKLIRLAATTVAVALLAAACGDDGTVATAPSDDGQSLAEVEEVRSAGSDGLFFVDPLDTGEPFTDGFGPHVVGAPDVEPRRELLVFFPGTGGDPTYYETILEHALDIGYHVLGLAYPNAEAVNFDLCGKTDDRTCQERARTEILYGIDGGEFDTELDVPPEDAAVTRLVAALDHLAANRAEEGWANYLDGDEPAWSSIATAGHSQGGGHAAFLALDHEVARALLFDATEPALWTEEEFATPPDRMWGIAHADEPIYPGISRSWVQLDLPGQSTELESGDADFDSHRLVMTATECSGNPESFGYYHGCPVTDIHLPDPVPESLTDAWTSMLTG